MYALSRTLKAFFDDASSIPNDDSLLKLIKLAQQRYKEAKSNIRLFNGDGKSDVTLTVWDFGGQKVSSAHGCVGEQLFIWVK